MKIPALLLKRLYTFGSLKNANGGVTFSIKNRLNDVRLLRVIEVSIDGEAVPLDRVTLDIDGGDILLASDVAPDRPVSFPLRQIVHLRVPDRSIEQGLHQIALAFDTESYGELSFRVKDKLSEHVEAPRSIPRDTVDDYAPEIIRARQEFVRSFTGKELHHVTRPSFDPAITRGNVEHFIGVAQVPIGIAGPLRINGEHAQGEFLIPLATTEGTLIASYNRGMKILNLCGGVTCTVSDDSMQRAPVFVFDSAREARTFRAWIEEHTEQIRDVAEATSSVAKLIRIESYLSNKFCFLRFNFSTGDAAGQNMVGRATFAACSWILDQLDNVRRFYLESNLATDKKASQVNVMRTRGKRVTAEVVLKRDVLVNHLRVEPRSLAYHSGVANVGAVLSGANNNGLHSPNSITAMFIATGQDVANVSESSAGIIYTELTEEEDLYLSFTIPSLIVATYGGGTGLATQRECLEILGCWGKGKVKKFAEIVAGVCLAGEISLAAAISALDWVSAHEQYGRNR